MDEQQVSLGEFVKQVASRIPDELHMPLKDEKPWHMLFYRLKKDSGLGKPVFFEDLEFDWVGPYPICQDLSDYIHALHFTGCMSAGNPTYDEISLNPGLAKKWAAEQLSGNLPGFIGRAMELAREEFAEQR
jgi:hypothetical protein